MRTTRVTIVTNTTINTIHLEIITEHWLWVTGLTFGQHSLLASGQLEYLLALQLPKVGNLHELPALVLVTDGLQLVAAVHLNHVSGQLGDHVQHILCGVAAVELKGGGPHCVHGGGRIQH